MSFNHGSFEIIEGPTSDYCWLPAEEFSVAVRRKDSAERIIGGAADAIGKTVALVRGDLTTLVVPFDYFQPSGDGLRPKFERLAFSDYGHTVSLGDYEASTDGILYEFDPEYRRKLKKARLAEERTFGASLRRLRLQRRLKQTDFAPLSAKTIARIERGYVEKPHGKTLDTLARRLQVAADQIDTY